MPRVVQALLLREGSLASIWRYKPTPESSDGTGDATGIFGLVTGVLVAGLACEAFLNRLGMFGTGVRVLVSQAGRVIVALA